MLIFRSIFGLPLILTLALLWAGPSLAASVVSVTSQSNTSVSGDGQCTLLEAFNASQDSAGGDCELVIDGDAEPLIIRLQSGATYLRTERLNLAFGAFESVQIDGRGATIGRDPAATALFSLIRAVSGASKALVLNDLTLRDGQARRSAALDVGGSAVTSLRLTRVSFIDNQALGTEIGQGLSGSFRFDDGSIQIADCLFSDNHADQLAGAVDLGSVTGSIVDTRFADNTSDGDAGALRITASELSIVRSVFNNNNAVVHGGAIDMETNTDLVIEQSTFSDNNADFNGGAIQISGPIAIRNSLFTGNTANGGGALHRPLPLAGTGIIQNSTFFGNTATGNGGAIWLERGVMELTGVTVVGNQSSNGGGIAVAGNPATGIVLDHSIVAGNTASSNANCFGPRRAEGGHSLLGSDCGFVSRPGDIAPVGAGVVDSVLRDNGGPTLTLAVTPGDGAHNGGNREYLQTTTTDQRGFPRIAQGRVDIGAHEYAAEAVGFPSVVFETSFELDEPQRFFDRQAFLDATGAGDVTGPFPGNGTVVGEFTQSGITFAPFGDSSLNFSSWTNALPDLGGPGGTNDLALNGLEEFDIRIQSPVTAFGFDFVDPDGDATPFNLLACATTFDPNDANCPLEDIVFSMDFSANDTNRLFVGFQIAEPFQQVSIREQTNSNTNEFFGHVFTAP